MGRFRYVGASEDAGVDADALDLLTLEWMAPARYAATTPFARHLDQAMASVALDMVLLDHVNAANGQGFDCTAYYADDATTQAWCAGRADTYVAVLGAGLARRLAAVCQRISDAVLPLDLSAEPRRDILRDPVLADLLSGAREVSEDEAEAVVATWPDAKDTAVQRPFDGCALFYDMVRLVWMHELAHALCGHVAFSRDRLGLSQLHEFSAERLLQGPDFSETPRHEWLQTIEIHADEFASRYCLDQMLSGSDPVNEMMGPRVDLGKRLVVFNLACCAFAVMWTGAERAHLPGVSFRPRRDAAERDPQRIHAMTPTSHPPAALRYMRFRGFQQIMCEAFARGRPEASAESFALMVDAASFGLVMELAQLAPGFEELLITTPMLAQTPDMKVLEAYEDHLMALSAKLAPALAQRCYLPWLMWAADGRS